ncbi:MAG: trypsin-like peptidase domain-containing protein [Planctomycetota bacterium]|jgi:serine protease Do|nr:trypsin-like peptidase domain-containing protein [Planctomycetota bacterium]
MTPMAVLFAALLLAGSRLSGAEPFPPESGGDARAIMAAARRDVFPAVIFLMPVAERFDGGKTEKTQAAGSGVIISPDGEAVTNQHVIDRAVEIRCLTSDGRARRATLVGADKDTDLALIRLERRAGETFPFARLGQSRDVEAGQFVMAMGAPWGLSRSVSMGIVSCVDRFLPGRGGYNLWFQTDASINPGNSGGPLVDAAGRVIGINSLASLLGGNLAFAIPADTVRFIVDRLRRDGRVIRAWTGIRLQPLRDFEKNIFYEGDLGVLVAGVDPGSPADLAGIGAGQLILSVNGRETNGLNHEDIPALNQLLSELPIGKPTAVTLAPDARGENQESFFAVELTPREKGDAEGGDFDCRRWNMTVKAINKFANPLLHFFRPAGVFIQGMKIPGNAAAAGLRSGDILVEIDGRPVEDLEACRRIYLEIEADAAREKKAVITVLRGGLRNYHVVDYAPRYGDD